MRNPTRTIERFLERVPHSAASVFLCAQTFKGVQQISEYPIDEIKNKQKTEIAQLILESAAAFSDAMNKEIMFLAQWKSKTDRVLETVYFKVAPAEGIVPPHMAIDGSMESWLAQLQGVALSKDKLQIEMMVSTVSIQRDLIAQLQDRIQFLEEQSMKYYQLKDELLRLQAETSTESAEDWEKKFNRTAQFIERFLLKSQNSH